MQIKTLQWNIGGGKLLAPDADINALSSYSVDGLDEIIEFLKSQQPDIITLQETHADADVTQAEVIAKALGYEYWFNDEYADSHIQTAQRLGQAVVSRFPISDHSFEWFTNPNFEVVWEDGSIARSHNKGRSRCQVDLGEVGKLCVQTLHTFPFRRFNVATDSPEAQAVLADMANHLATQDKGLIQGDFNIDAPLLKPYLSHLFEVGYQEVEQTKPTTPKGRHYDHILFNGLELIDSQTVSDVKTDHYPVVSTFEV